MPADSHAPFSVFLCEAIIRFAALAVPSATRKEWKERRLIEIWHRWQFLAFAGAWDAREALLLVRSSIAAFRDAARRFSSQHLVQAPVRTILDSPWTCLAASAGILLILGAVTSGFPATRQLLTFESHPTAGRVLFIWRHPAIGGGDRGFPSDVAPAWATRSRLLENVAAFNVTNMVVTTGRNAGSPPIVFAADHRLFQVLSVKPALGVIPKASALVLDHDTWLSLFHADRNVIGSRVRVGQKVLSIAAVLPPGVQFFTRHPAVYLIEPVLTDKRVMIVARARPGATIPQINRELTNIAEEFCFYWFRSQLRLRFFETSLFTPMASFAVAVLAGVVMALMLSRARLRHARAALRAEKRAATLRRLSFFFAKITLGLAILFVAGLEWSRSESSLMFASRDPASGPFLLWFYIAGAMGVFFCAIVDQRARCRVCLELLCFPVRIGSPGCLLLDWSGTELLCSQGHGVLHVPLLAPTWDEEAERWITLDESWQGLFADSK